MTEHIQVEISKINFLLENLYALQLRDMGFRSTAVPELAEELCRQVLLPGTQYGGGMTAAELATFQELVAHRIAMFCAGVQERLRSVEDGDGRD